MSIEIDPNPLTAGRWAEPADCLRCTGEMTPWRASLDASPQPCSCGWRWRRANNAEAMATAVVTIPKGRSRFQRAKKRVEVGSSGERDARVQRAAVPDCTQLLSGRPSSPGQCSGFDHADRPFCVLQASCARRPGAALVLLFRARLARSCSRPSGNPARSGCAGRARESSLRRIAPGMMLGTRPSARYSEERP